MSTQHTMSTNKKKYSTICPDCPIISAFFYLKNEISGRFLRKESWIYCAMWTYAVFEKELRTYCATAISSRIDMYHAPTSLRVHIATTQAGGELTNRISLSTFILVRGERFGMLFATVNNGSYNYG